MKRRLILYYLILMANTFVYGQSNYSGSFLMSFNSSKIAENPPLLWNIDSVSRGGKMVLEIQDEMLKKGVSKRVLFSPADSMWTMMMEYNKVKQGTRIRAAAMYRDTASHRTIVSKNVSGKKIIEGFSCKKINIESDSCFAEVWYTDQISFDLCKIYRLLSHCGLMSEVVRKGDWFHNKKIKSMVLEVTSRNKSNGETYTIKISDIKPGIIDSSYFTTDGFRISEIPEGQNCGVEAK